MRVSRKRRVGLLIESSRAYGRDLLRGIARYAREHGAWSIVYQERKLEDPVPPWLRRWEIDGIIARMETRALANAILARGVPAVDVRGALPDLEVPVVYTDNAQISRLAAEHLRERGFRNFAFCGFVGTEFSDQRSTAFFEWLNRAGFACHVYAPPKTVPRALTTDYEADGLRYEPHVAQWLRALPKPVGLMACNDIRGQQILYACREMGITVPDEVAVIGVDNDELLCELCDPPLSSVAQDTEHAGYEAAAMLERMMAGRRAPKRPLYLPPLGIVARRSTDVLAISDRAIAGAVRFIREHACDGIDVGDLLDAVPMSRTVLERRFVKLVGHSPKAEILRVQMERAKELLATTDLRLEEIAAKVGYDHHEYFCVVFKRETGQTPGEFRRQGK